LRILHVLNELRHSGAETSLALMAPFAAAAGVRAEILAVVEGQEIGDYAPRLQSAGYQLHRLQFTRDAGFPVRALAFFRAERFDAVHIHCERAAFWLEAAAQLAGVRRVLRTVHGLFLFEGGLRLRRAAQRALARSLLGVRTLAVSAGVAANERARFGNPATETQLCIDVDAFRPPTEATRAAARARLGLSKDELCVSIVGACDPVKSHDVAFAALAIAVRSGVNIRVLHAGTGATEPAERTQVERLGIANRVAFLGARNDVPAILAASDLYIMSSRVEGLGMAAVEALATGLRCVLSDRPGIDALRAFGGAVEWVPPEVETVAGALIRLARAPEAEWRMQTNTASDAVRAEFAPEAAWRRLCPFYGV
jgi:glycosyltransferase involved in cell wall biosynthesis